MRIDDPDGRRPWVEAFESLYLNFTFSTLNVTRWPSSNFCWPPTMFSLSASPPSHASTGLRLLCVCLVFACLLLSLAACGGGGGGGLSTAGPVVLVDGSDRIDDGGDADSDAARGLHDESGPKDEGGVPTPRTVPDPAHYETAAYHYGGSRAPLAATRFSAAYARGWTGLGSLVTIADTGVDADHPDLAAGIFGARDFTGTGINDTHGHGTHVAGIVGARRNAQDMHGAAFDAQLAIAKVASTSSYSFALARQAADWGRQSDSVAVNVSAAYLRNRYLESFLVPVSFGMNGSVLLRRVDVRGLQSGRSLVTVVGENPMRFQEQRGHFWHVATPTLIERSLLTAFNDASSDLVFGTADSLDKPDFRLIVTVTRFAYDPAGEAMVNFDATVTASGGDVLLARSYWGRAPLADATPAGGVNAIGAALGEAMTVFSRELADVL